MYNRAPYNRERYNRKSTSIFEWVASATAESGSGGALLIVRRFKSEVEAVASASGAFNKLVFFAGEATAESGSSGAYIRIVFFDSEVEAEANAYGSVLSTYGQEIMIIEGVNMSPGDELIIDTEHMTVTLNGENAIDLVKDESIFFKLKEGSNDIIVEGGTMADIRILWKDRWL